MFVHVHTMTRPLIFISFSSFSDGNHIRLNGIGLFVYSVIFALYSVNGTIPMPKNYQIRIAIFIWGNASLFK